MHDAQMHDNEAFNAWRILQRSKELDQGPKEHKLNHRNLSSSKWNDCLEWVSHEKWDENWKNIIHDKLEDRFTTVTHRFQDFFHTDRYAYITS